MIALVDDVIRWTVIVLLISGFGTAAVCLFLHEFGHHDREGDQ